MFFCQNCSKLLDEDLKVCPYCGADEEGYVAAVPEEVISGERDAQSTELNETAPPVLQEPVLVPENSTLAQVLQDAVPPPSFDGSIDETINRINEMIENNHKDVPDAGAIQPGFTPRAQVIPENESLTQGQKVAFILLSIFVAPVGLVFAIIYVGKPDPKLKSFGRTLLIISIVAMVLFFLCCCGTGIASILYNF